MKHNDGIEVYLRYYNSKRQHGGYAESELPLTNDHDGHRQRFVMKDRGERVEVTIELSKSFDMHGATALHVGLGRGDYYSQDPELRYTVYHAHKFSNGPIRLSYNDQRHVEAILMPHTKEFRRGKCARSDRFLS